MTFLFLMKSIFVSLLGAFWTALCSVVTVLIVFFAKRSQIDALITVWTRVFCATVGLRIHVVGKPSAHQGVLYVFNHSSHLDIPVLCWALAPHQPRFGAKEELFRIPLFGPAIRALGTLKIARGDRAQVFQVYKNAQEKLMRGESFVLAPEGTRQASGKLGEFKSGPFIFAIEAKATLVPVFIEGAGKALAKGDLFINQNRWSSDIKVTFLSPIDAGAFTYEQRGELKERVFQTMKKFSESTE